MAQASVLIQLGLDAKDFSKGIKLATRDFNALGKQLRTVGLHITTSISAPIAGAAYAALNFSEKARDAFSRFGDSIKTTLSKVGDDIATSINLEGILEGISSFIKTIADFFVSLPLPIKTAMLSLAGFFAIVGPGIVIISHLITVLGALHVAIMGPFGITMGLIAAAVTAAGALYGITKLGDATKKLSDDFRTTEEKIASAKRRLEELSRVNLEEAKTRIIKLKIGIEELRLEIEKIESKPFAAPGIMAGSWGTGLDTRKKQLAELGAELKKLQEAIDGTAEAEQRKIIIDAESSKITQELSENQTVLIREYLSGGQLVDYYSSRLSALTSARKKLLEGNTIESNNVKKLTAEIYELTTAHELEAAKLAEQSAVRKASTEQMLLGGGTNVVKAQLDAQLNSYQRISDFIALNKDLPIEQQKQLSDALIQTRTNIEALQSPTQQFLGLLQEIPPLSTTIVGAMMNVFTSFASGVGDAFANMLIYGESFSKSFVNLIKQVAASFIKTIISGLMMVLVQKILVALLSIPATALEVSAQMAGMATYTYGAAFASTCAIPIVGPALAAGVAAASVTEMLAGAAASAALGGPVGTAAVLAGSMGAAEGGIFKTPGLFSIVEKGEPEIVLNKRNVREFLGAGAGMGGTLHVTLEVDGERMAEKVLRLGPEILRFNGITI